VENFKIRKIAKIITIIIISVGFICLFAWLFCPASLRFFLLEHPGLMAVFIGVAGEVYFDWGEETGRHSRWKKFFMALLVVGLAYELFEASESDKKAATAIELAGKANEHAANTESDNWILQSNVFTLQKSIVELIHSYDISTNALAKANISILSISNVAILNSPINFPLEYVEGYCVIGISSNDVAYFKNWSTLTALVTLNRTRGFMGLGVGVDIPCRIESAETDRNGDLVLSFTVKWERHKTPGASANDISFNNLSIAQIDFASANEPPFLIKGGFLRIEVNSRFNCQFRFQPQTNRIGGDWGIVGQKESEWPL
jgi:hypothetical protein